LHVIACSSSSSAPAANRARHGAAPCVEHRAPGATCNITGRHLIDELDRLAVDRGYPAVLRCDNGPELACAAMADWAGERVGLHFGHPSSPGATAISSRFNSRVRDECLNINMFWSLAQARAVISDWKADYNHRRRHSALGYQAPAVYAAARTHP
jgi:putative transposase